jgi:uncharacterized phage infection (PIP) family protein YhgE
LVSKVDDAIEGQQVSLNHEELVNRQINPPLRQPDENIAKAIATLTSNITTPHDTQLYYDQFQTNLNSLMELIIGINNSFANTDHYLNEGIKQLTEQLHQEQKKVLLLKQQNEELGRETHSTSSGSGKLEQYKEALRVRHESLEQILTDMGYNGDGDQSAAIRLLLTDITDRPEQLAFGVSLTNLQKYLTECGPLDSPIYRACKLNELQKLQLDTNNQTLFEQGSPVTRIKGRWKGQLSLIFRADLLLNTYWPSQEPQLQTLLGECVLATKHLLHKRDFYPHELALLEQSALIKGQIEYEPNRPSNEALQNQIDFITRVKPLAEQGPVYCDVATWGYDLVDAAGNKEVGEKSLYVGKEQDSTW